MIPAGNVVVNIWVGPLLGVHVPNNQVVVLGLRVPTTIGVELVLKSEEGVTTTTFWHWGLGWDGLVSLPSLGLNVEGVDIAEGDSSVVKTTVTTIDPELALVMADTSVGTGWWGTDSGVLVDGDGLVTGDAAPGPVRHLQPPAIVKTLGWVGVPTVDEDTVILWCSNSNVLGTSWWDLITTAFLLLPTALLEVQLHGVNISGWGNLAASTGILDTTVHDVVAAIDERKSVTRAGLGACSFLSNVCPG